MTLSIPELRALVAAATPGPWVADRSPAGYNNVLLEPGTIIMSGDADPRCWPDAAFIAAARTAIPELLDRVEQLEAESDQVQALKEGLREAIDWATGATGPDDARWGKAMTLISEAAMKRIFPGWTCGAADYYTSRLWHVVYGPDNEGYYSMPQGGTNIHADKLRDGDILTATSTTKLLDRVEQLEAGLRVAVTIARTAWLAWPDEVTPAVDVWPRLAELAKLVEVKP